LTGGRVGRAIEPRNFQISERRRSRQMRKATPEAPITPGAEGLARSKNQGTHVDLSCGNREILWLAGQDGGPVRNGNPKGASRR